MGDGQAGGVVGGWEGGGRVVGLGWGKGREDGEGIRETKDVLGLPQTWEGGREGGERDGEMEREGSRDKKREGERDGGRERESKRSEGGGDFERERKGETEREGQERDI